MSDHKCKAVGGLDKPNNGGDDTSRSCIIAITMDDCAVIGLTLLWKSEE